MKGRARKRYTGGDLQVLELVAKATEVLRRSRDTRPTTRNPPVSLVVLMRTVQRRSCGKEPHTMRKHTIAPEHRSFRPKTKFASAAVLTVSMLTFGLPAGAQSPQCAAREAVLERLSDHYQDRKSTRLNSSH